MNRLALAYLAVCIALPAIAQSPSEPEFREGMRENLLTYIGENDCVATICIYEQQWIPPTRSDPHPPWKAKLWHRAVVTEVHKGDISVGTQLEYYYNIEDPTNLFGPFRSTVPGKLEYLFFSMEATRREGNKLKIGVGAYWSCDCLKGIFAELFQEELARNPSLNPKSEQDGAVE